MEQINETDEKVEISENQENDSQKVETSENEENDSLPRKVSSKTAELANTKSDYLLKFVVIGESGTGKTSSLMRFVENTFSEIPSKTIEDIRYKILTMNENVVKIQLWDTAGQEKYKTITKGFYRGARAILIFYDITDKKSYECLKDWIHEATRYKESKLPVKLAVIGNKKDLEANRVISSEEAKKLAQQNGADYYEASAKTGENVDKYFIEIVKEVLKTAPKISSSSSFYKPNDIIKLENKPITNNNKKETNCCTIA